MIYQESAFPAEQQEYYKIYAAENQLDYAELCLLDRLCSLNKRITWTLALEQLPFSKGQLANAVRSLQEQQLVRTTFDLIILKESAMFFLQDILEDLHSRYHSWLEETQKDRDDECADPGPVHILA